LRLCAKKVMSPQEVTSMNWHAGCNPVMVPGVEVGARAFVKAG